MENNSIFLASEKRRTSKRFFFMKKIKDNSENTEKAEHYFTAKPKSKLRKYKFEAEARGIKFIFNSGSGIFSAKEIDKGSLVLVENMELPQEGKILDLGCGYGFVGIAAAKLSPASEIIMTDINKRACDFAETNIELNKITNAKVIHGEYYEPVEKEVFDLILLNPPQTAGKDVCIRLIGEAVEHLSSRGSLQIVARRNKGGAALFELMDSLFDETKKIANKSGYWVYKGLKI